MKNGQQQDPKLDWRRCFQWGALMMPVTLLGIYLVLSFLPAEWERTVKVWASEYWMLSFLLLYLLSVLLFRQMRFDFRRKEDWDAGL